MSYNGSGTFVRLENWTADAAAGILIRADRMDTDSNDFAGGLTTAICKDGQSTTSAQIPFAFGLKTSDGTVGGPAHSFTSETNSGLYRISAGNIGISASGSLVGTFNSNGLDNTVIGAGTPKAGSFSTLSIGANVLATTAATTSWTPGLSFGGGTTGLTYTTRSGSYQVVGKILVANFTITLSSKGSSSGTALITGLPVTVNNMTSNSGAICVALGSNMSTIGAGIILQAGPGTTTANIYTPSSTGVTALADTNFGNTSLIEGTIVYFQ